MRINITDKGNRVGGSRSTSVSIQKSGEVQNGNQ